MVVAFLGIVAMFIINIAMGSVPIPVEEAIRIVLGQPTQDTEMGEIWSNIIFKTRIPQAMTAIIAGAGLSVAGLEMQTVFRNPLAGPSVLGVSNGASLGVALLILLSGAIGGKAMSSLGLYGNVAITVAAAIGAISVMGIIAMMARAVKGNVTLLIVGVMIGYIANAIISILKYFSPPEDIHAYTIWGLGSFASVSSSQISLFAGIMVVLLAAAMLLIKPLNMLLLGENYAQNLGLNVAQARVCIILSSGFLVAICTAFCGPISFLGLAVPHLARGLFRTADHRIIMPASLLTGALLALACNLIARIPGAEGALPVNSVTSLIGAPVVIWVIFSNRRR
ncbi:MAG: iron ABC transporter permease [Bacteroidaceae bacterium]|nr:iron ABC transporter permease [Bacteroidaceae bacterium]